MNQPKPIVTDDAFLLRRVSEGNGEAFNLLYERYWQQAYASAYRRLQDHDSAKDIVQEIFTHIWLKRDSLHLDSLPAYLNVAVRNRVFKFLERQKLQHPFFNILETMPASNSNTDASILWKEFFKSYEALLNALPERRQIIFRKRYQDDLSTTEIAFQMGLSRKTVQNQLGKAVEQLRMSLFNLLSIMIVLLLCFL